MYSGVTNNRPSDSAIRSFNCATTIDYEKITSGGGGPYGGGTTSRDAWKVSLDIGEKVKIKHTTKKENMLNLATEISKFIGSELLDNSTKPETSFGQFFSKVKGFFSKGEN